MSMMDGPMGAAAKSSAGDRFDKANQQPAQQSLQQVNYRACTDGGQKCCGNCRYFDGRGACQIVAGNIDPQATCDLWAGGGATALPSGPQSSPQQSMPGQMP